MQITEAHRLELVKRAVEARRHAYAPYSKYAVGAALLGKTGQMFSGANVENAAYPTGMCAERTALFHAVSEGEREFAAIAVVTENGGSPCGACRQALSEFGLGTVVLLGRCRRPDPERDDDRSAPAARLRSRSLAARLKAAMVAHRAPPAQRVRPSRSGERNPARTTRARPEACCHAEASGMRAPAHVRRWSPGDPLV